MINNKIQAYALGCLSAEEIRQFRKDIEAEHDFNFKNLGKFQNLVALLPSALAAENPDEKVKEKIARKLFRFKIAPEKEQQESGEKLPEPVSTTDIAKEIINKSTAETGPGKFVRVTGQDSQSAPPAEIKTSKDFADIKLTSRRSLRPVKVSRVLIYTIMALMLGFAAAYFYFNSRIGDLGIEIERLNADLQKAAEESTVSSGLLSLLEKKDTKTFLLSGSETYPDGFGKIYLNYSTSAAYLYMSDIPLLPPGKKYQLWFRNNNSTYPIGLFEPQTEEGYFYFTMPKLGRETARGFIMTEEPEEGSVMPGRKVYLVSVD